MPPSGHTPVCFQQCNTVNAILVLSYFSGVCVGGGVVSYCIILVSAKGIIYHVLSVSALILAHIHLFDQYFSHCMCRLFKQLLTNLVSIQVFGRRCIPETPFLLFFYFINFLERFSPATDWQLVQGEAPTLPWPWFWATEENRSMEIDGKDQDAI